MQGFFSEIHKGLETVGSNSKVENCNERFVKGLNKGVNQNVIGLILCLLHTTAKNGHWKRQWKCLGLFSDTTLSESDCAI